MRRPFEWAGIGIALALCSCLTHKALFRLCDAIAWIGWRVDVKGVARSRENLRRVIGREIPRSREDIILKRSYRNMMRTLGHVFWTSRSARKRAASVGKFEPSCFKQLSSHSPYVTVSGHLGCWEILSQLVFLSGRPIVSVAKPIGTKGMTELLMKSRRSLGQSIVPAEGAFRPLMQGLKDGSDVGLLVDQVVRPKDGGVWVRFFGVPVPVSVAPAFLAAKAKAPIIVAWSRPLKDGTYRCEMIANHPWEKGMDVWGMTQKIISELEGTIRRHPSCWVLNYNYFRKKPSPEELSQLEEREAKRGSAGNVK